MEPVTCPNCRTFVVPTRIGECPACRTAPDFSRACSNRSNTLRSETAMAPAADVKNHEPVRDSEALSCSSRCLASPKEPTQLLTHRLVPWLFWILPGIAFGTLGILGSRDCVTWFYMWWILIHPIGCSESKRLREWWITAYFAPALVFFAMLIFNPFQLPRP